MLAKLSTITTLYRKFTKNQVLTEGHLNEIVDFFDDQDRISRIGLSGVGIICGFQVTHDQNAKNITITQGSGITTDGDLFHLYNTIPNGDKIIDFESKQYTHYKIHDNKKAAYKPYFYNGTEQLQIFELLTAEQQALDTSNTFTISNLKKNTGLEVDDAVLLLYIETYEKKADLCVSLSCDNQGLEIIGNHKALLVSKEVALQINSHDLIFNKVNFANLYYKLPSVISNRIVLQPENFISYNEIKKTFTNGIFKNNVVKKLHEGFEILLNGLQMPEILNSIQKSLAELFDFDENNVPSDFQYRYDLLNDLINTYNEIKDLLSTMNGEFCCPDLKSFPKHLMLGEIVKNKPYFEYRHGFYKSPLLTGQNLSTANDCLPFDMFNEQGKKEEVTEFIIDPEGKEIKICYGKNTDLQQLYSLIKRASQLLANYSSNFNSIKITPSFELGVLGKKAIPFYNNVGNHLIELWDYEKTAFGKQRSNRSYHDNLLNTKHPLEFIADHDFYRIEGHQGMNYKEALKIIQDIRRQNGLAFNVVVLAVSEYEAKEVLENFTSYYLNKNHGYEHKAGVPPGGTFVMIYFEGESIVSNPVIADFTLPYLCCDDNFISLSLPVNKLCFDDTTPHYPFHVTPTGGFVKADVKEDLNGGVTKNQFGEFVFDPKLVSEELIGQLITFTVNNLETQCEIIIFKKPKFDFTTVINIAAETNEVIVDFVITGENQPEMKYVWNFGDGSKNLTTSETKVQHIYKYELTEYGIFTFPVTVVGENGSCSLEVEHPVTFEITNIKISIDNRHVCRNDDTPYVITIEPAAKNVILSGDGVSLNDEGQYVFTAYDVPENVDQVIVMINDKPSDLVITMKNIPVALFTYTIKNDELILTNNSTDADFYRWDIEGEIIETEYAETIVRTASKYSTAIIQVSLTAMNKYCGEATDGPREVPLRGRVPVTKCLKSARTFVTETLTEIERTKELSASEHVSEEIIILLTEIQQQFLKVQENTIAYISGELNNELVGMFTEQIYIDLLQAANNSETEAEKTILTVLVESHISLFYIILKCQEAEKLQKFEKEIRGITALFENLLSNLYKMQFSTDPDGTLKNFLNEMVTVFKEIEFMVNEIKRQLEVIA